MRGLLIVLSYILCYSVGTGSAQDVGPYRTTTKPHYTNLWIELDTTSTTFTEGDSVNFYCQLEANHHIEAQFQFWKGDVIVASVHDNWFHMPDLKSSDSGEYWCSIVTNEGKLKSMNSVTITVGDHHHTDYPSHEPYPTGEPDHNMEPPTLMLHKPLAFYYEGAGVHFSCEASSYDPYVTYELHKHDGTVYVQREKDFYLYNVHEWDSGRYTCAVVMQGKTVHSHNDVYLEVRPYAEPEHVAEAETHWASHAPTTYSSTALITSLVLVVMGTLMG